MTAKISGVANGYSQTDLNVQMSHWKNENSEGTTNTANRTILSAVDGSGVKELLDQYRNQGVDLQLSGTEIDFEELKEQEKREEQQRMVQEERAMLEMYQQQLEATKENIEGAKEGYEDMARALEIARRMMSGDTVPGSDEKFLMDFNKDIYMGAKNMQAIARNENSKEHDSILEEEEKECGGVTVKDSNISVDASGLELGQQPQGKPQMKSIAEMFSGGVQV